MDILIADDSAVSRRLLEAELTKWGFRVTAVGSGAEAWSILQGEDAPRLAILDWMMPGLSGPEVCRRVRDHNKQEHYTYILLLTSRHEKEDLIRGMEAGADDYLVKPFDHNELKVRLGPGRRIVELQQELGRARDELREQATRDALTHLWNRHAIFEILDRELSRCVRANEPLGLLMADLDRFKDVNDTHGHLAGDAVLAEVAIRMSHSVRPYDAVGRYGGEEFLVILPGCDGENAVATAERIREMIGHQPIDAGNACLPVTMSFGATSVQHPSQANLEDLIRVADRALYRAKDLGRNRSIYLPAE